MRILWLKSDLLLPLDKGGKLRTWHLMRQLASRHAITFLSFAQYALPLAFLQLYFFAQRSRTASLQWATAAVLSICALGTLAGSAAAAAMLWLPHI